MGIWDYNYNYNSRDKDTMVQNTNNYNSNPQIDPYQNQNQDFGGFRPFFPTHINYENISTIYPTGVSSDNDTMMDYFDSNVNGSESLRKRRNSPYDEELDWDDATWILICSMIIFSMQTGFGLLEVGVVSQKNTTNIMMKNVVDVVLGGFSYWLFGFAMSYGMDWPSTSWLGFGEYVVDAPIDKMGPVFTTFFFQLSFATTATTIASGSMAERCDFRAYCLFSLLNTVVYAVPARWIWSPSGFLYQMGVIDIAGSGGVHLLGGVCAFVAAWMLGPRLGRYDKGIDPLPIRNSVEVIVGLFMLWWAWIAFNSGSTFGITGEKWKFSARATVTTIMAAIGGGLVGIVYMFIKGRFEVMDTVNCILGGLVGITAPCALVHALDSVLIGIIGGIVVIVTSSFADRLRVDDPIGATAVHGFGGIWGLLSVGIFAENDGGNLGATRGRSGVLRGGGWYLLGIQSLAAVCIIAYTAASTFILLWLIDKLFFRIRMKDHEQILGADFVEHYIWPRDLTKDYPPEIYAVGTHEEIIEAMKLSYENSKRKSSEMILNTLKPKKTDSEKLAFWTRLWRKKKNDHKDLRKIEDLNHNTEKPSIPVQTQQQPQLQTQQLQQQPLNPVTNPPNNPQNAENCCKNENLEKTDKNLLLLESGQPWQNRFSGGKKNVEIVDLNDPGNYYYPEGFHKSYYKKKRTFIWME